MPHPRMNRGASLVMTSSAMTSARPAWKGGGTQLSNDAHACLSALMVLSPGFPRGLLEGQGWACLVCRGPRGRRGTHRHLLRAFPAGRPRCRQGRRASPPGGVLRSQGGAGVRERLSAVLGPGGDELVEDGFRLLGDLPSFEPVVLDKEPERLKLAVDVGGSLAGEV